MQIRGYDIIGINIGKYSYNNNTAISLDCNEGAFATITVNLDENLDEDMAYLDTNNCSWVEDIMEKYDAVILACGASNLRVNINKVVFVYIHYTN